MTAIVLIFGVVIGSFLSVCIYRIPLPRLEIEGEDEAARKEREAITIGHPVRSFCPHCRATLTWRENIPLLSWLLLRGRCRHCRHPISARYPAVELLSALMAWLSWYSWGLTPTGVLVYLFCCALIVISFIDYDYYIIPNVISLPGTALGLVVALLNQFTGFFGRPVVPDLAGGLLGILIGAGFLLLVSEVYLRIRKREGLGMGDVKLLAMTGAFFGMEASIYTIFVGSLLGSVLGIAFIVFRGRTLSHQLPFGPYLALGTVLYLFGGDHLFVAGIDWLGSLYGAVP